MPCRSRWTGIGKLLRQRYQLWDPNECASPQDHLIRTMRANDKVWVTWPYRISFLWKKFTVLDTFFKGKLSWYTHGGFHCWHFFLLKMQVSWLSCWPPVTDHYHVVRLRSLTVPIFLIVIDCFEVSDSQSVHLSFCIIYTRYFEVFLANC